MALDPFDGVNPLTLPVVAALGLQVVDLALLAALMNEERPEARPGATASIRAVPSVVASATRLIRGSVVLACLVAVEFFWGFGMTTFESLFPPRVAETMDDPEGAAALLGPVTTVAWFAAAAGAAVVPRLTRRLGAPTGAMVLHTVQAAAVLAMAAVGGTGGVVAFYVVTMAGHGAVNPIYQSLLHEQADSAHRATVLSAASMATHPGGALGGVVLGSIADAASISTAMVVGALVLLCTVPLYLPARHLPARYSGK